MVQEQSRVERVSSKQAAKELNMGVESVHYLMQQNRLPIGYVIRREGKKRHSYIIFRGLLDEEIKRIAAGKNKW